MQTNSQHFASTPLGFTKLMFLTLSLCMPWDMHRG